MIFHLKIHGAQDIPKMDVVSESDTFCVVTHTPSNAQKRTVTIANSSTPEWAGEFHFRVVDPESESFVITVNDDDPGKPDKIASYTVVAADLVEGVVTRWQFPLTLEAKLKDGKLKPLIDLEYQLGVTGRPAFVPYGPPE
jgi:Ca2+-dependent lipid-binding protein